MKAYLIDPAERSIRTIEIERQGESNSILSDLYHALDCQLVDRIAEEVIEGHDIWLDDEGLSYDEPPHGLFAIPSTSQQIFAGRAVVLGYDDEGECAAATCTAQDVASRVFAVLDMTRDRVTAAPLGIIEADSAAA